jgi:hypothetical protein
MFTLTKDNYYDPARPHVSVSQIKDYLRDPAFYYRRHVLKDPAVQIVPTDAMKRGTVVDDLLTRGQTSIQPRVLKRDDPELYEEQQHLPDSVLIGQSYWDEAVEINNTLLHDPLWMAGQSESEYQVLLQGNINGVKVCGLADRICGMEIIDLKVTNANKISSPEKWMWNCIEMKYAHQFAMYQHLFSEKVGINKTDMRCRHVCAAYIEPGFVEVKSFIVPQPMIDAAYLEIVSALDGIKNKKFDKKVHQIETLPYF